MSGHDGPGTAGRHLEALAAAPDGEPYTAVVETHTSVLLLMGARVYKVKKPVRLPFLDLSTQELRVANCLREVELNRRTAPDVYLGVARLTAAFGEFDEVGEPVVVMRRMPSSRRLTALIADPARRGVARRCVEEVAEQIARFHAALEPVTGSDVPATMTRLWREGWEQTERFGGDLLDPVARAETYALAGEYLAGRGGLLAEREERGLVRDGHGDLLSDDVYLLDDGARVLDCLEFDAGLRIGDVLLDLAFLMMDLTLHGAADLARELVDRYRQFDPQSHPRSLEHHYVAYRAWVRAKVECLKSETGDPAARQRAAAALDLARRESRAARVHLVPVGGLPGTGKSTLARALVEADDRDWVLLSSDEIRKELAGLAPTTRAGASYGAGIYDAEHTARTYAEMLRRAGTALERGVNAILDASWTDPTQRGLVERLGAEHAVAVTPVVCTAPLELCRQRMARRRTGPHVSDADDEVLARMAERPLAWPGAATVDTSGSVGDTAGSVLGLLDERPHRPVGGD